MPFLAIHAPKKKQPSVELAKSQFLLGIADIADWQDFRFSDTSTSSCGLQFEAYRHKYHSNLLSVFWLTEMSQPGVFQLGDLSLGPNLDRQIPNQISDSN